MTVRGGSSGIIRLSHEEIVERQKGLGDQLRFPLVVVLDNIRSLLNVGTVFRVADGAGVSKIYLCGITGYPPQGGISKTALGAEDSVPWEYHQDASKTVMELKRQGYTIVALEQTANGLSYAQYSPDFPVCLVIGNEVEGVSPELIGLCDRAIEIPMAGVKNSLNVAVAFGIAAFALREKFKMLGRR